MEEGFKSSGKRKDFGNEKPLTKKQVAKALATQHTDELFEDDFAEEKIPKMKQRRDKLNTEMDTTISHFIK
jgi:hypothetical protein